MTNLFALKTAAQSDVNDVVTEGKVKFTLEKNDETGRNEMVMRYSYYDVDGMLDYAKKTCPPTCHGADMLVSFIEERADFLNANYYWQAEAQKANVHPQMFKQWRDSNKVAKGEFQMLSFENN